MRTLALIPLLLVGACGGGGESAQNKAVTAPPATIAAGQWELTSEVTAFHGEDAGPPKINTPVGTRATESVCVGAETQAPSELFSGAGLDCQRGSYYVRNGRLNVTLNCRREGLIGSIPVTAGGTFQTDTLEYQRSLRTILSGNGDVAIDTRVTGRRTGDCTPPATGAAR
jgi:hypothetical protein